MKTERTTLLRSRKRQWELVSWNLSVKKANETDWLLFSGQINKGWLLCKSNSLSLSLQGVIMKKEQVKKYKSQRVDPTGNTDALFLVLKQRCETLTLFVQVFSFIFITIIVEHWQNNNSSSSSNPKQSRWTGATGEKESNLCCTARRNQYW